MDYNRVVNSLVFIMMNKSLVIGINITILKRRSFMLLKDLSQQSFTHSLVNKSNICWGYSIKVPIWARSTEIRTVIVRCQSKNFKNWQKSRKMNTHYYFDYWLFVKWEQIILFCEKLEHFLPCIGRQNEWLLLGLLLALMPKQLYIFPVSRCKYG